MLETTDLPHINKFEISVSQFPTHYSPVGNGDVSDILDSDHLSITFHLLDHVRTRNPLDLVDKFPDWKQFQSLTFELISPRIQVNLWEEASKAACDFTASIALVYRLSTRKIAVLGLNNDLPGLDSLLKHKWRLRKLARNLGSSM
jgi:hypothetical protein